VDTRPEGDVATHLEGDGGCVGGRFSSLGHIEAGCDFGSLSTRLCFVSRRNINLYRFGRALDEFEEVKY
jgi:hypothetical protein